MRKWIFSTQPNIVVVGVAYACSLFIVGDNAVAQDASPPPDQPLPAYISAANPALLIDQNLELSIRFQSLLSQWHVERGATSSIVEMCTVPAYLQIMALGPEVIPLIINQLRSEENDPDHWFFALHYLTKGFDPVPEQDKGDMAKMATAWLEWADREGYAG